MQSHRQRTLTIAASGITALCGVSPLLAQVERSSAAPTTSSATTIVKHWREAERGILENHVQLTFEDRFYKAGEAYFSPDNRWIIFQAVENPEPETEPDHFYAMYIAKLQYRGESIVGCDDPILVSPPGSANTCGWFDPIDPSRIYFGSTIVVPSASEAPGFQRDSSKYKWMFPPETEVVTMIVPEIFRDRNPNAPMPPADVMAIEPITRNDTYDAEGSLTSDGRFLLYTSLRPGANLCDLFIKDMKTHREIQLTAKPGYDGGPFFSPDGKRITYRSDRHGNNLLQLFVAELAFDSDGVPTGIKREFQITDEANVVNWCPFWHPQGRHLVYATSAMGHDNYEVFITTADPGNLEGSDGTVRYGLRRRQVTHGPGFDGLPVFNSDGSYMMWTSQRTDKAGQRGKSQLWVANFKMELDPVDPVPADPTDSNDH